jgi:hypothetical protein
LVPNELLPVESGIDQLIGGSKFRQGVREVGQEKDDYLLSS